MDLVSGILLLFGFGFLVANVKLAFDYVRYRKRQRAALLVWRPPKPPHYTFGLGLGVALGLLVFAKIVLLRRQAFGEVMMFLYYAYFFPMSLTIGRGFYEDGIWTEGGYIPYHNIGGLTWREGAQPTLVLLYRWRTFARKLIVPEPYYGQARRLLRDKIATHDIHFTGKTLDLGLHDERDDV